MELAAPAIWLRDNCSCERCRHANGQKLHGVNDITADLRVAEITEIGAEIRIRFDGDPHEAVFDRGWLTTWWSQARGDVRTEDAKQPWSGEIPECDWDRYLAEPSSKLAALEAVLRKGFVLLRGVPADDGAVLDVAHSFGFVRVTNYGDLFDVRVEADPTNLACTALPINPHTDNPYRDPVPTMQLLHCLHNAASGGDSGLVDGFRAGRIREIRFNNRSLQPLRGSVEQVEEFYAAYRAFDEILNRQRLRLLLCLARGDCLVFDNTRVLHARTAFDSAGERHLQGCYADLDGLASTVAVLRRELG